jgi:DNA polymerase IV
MPDHDRARSTAEEPNGHHLAEPARPRKIIHIDMDAFYASVEQRDNPELRGKPVAVGGAQERGVVAAASYEARKFGVHSAMPSVTAKRKCPDLIFVKPRFDVYRAVSLQIHTIFAEFTPVIEPLSLDEAYLDVTENLKSIRSATQIAEDIRAKIRQETKLTASAGVSYNKFLAKLASVHHKPDGLFVITPKMGPAFVETLLVAKFHGVGPATTVKMNRLGIETGLDLRAHTLPFLQQHFGKSGSYYYWIARGVDDRPVCAARVRKSVGAENTFSRNLHAYEAMRDATNPLRVHGSLPLPASADRPTKSALPLGTSDDCASFEIRSGRYSPEAEIALNARFDHGLSAVTSMARLSAEGNSDALRTIANSILVRVPERFSNGVIFDENLVSLSAVNCASLS